MGTWTGEETEMSMCSGKTLCDIYRDKKYCRKVEEKQDARGICNCRHAALGCEVGKCTLEDICGIKMGYLLPT